MAKNMTLKEMKRIGEIDITNYTHEERENLSNTEKTFTKIGYGIGTYGLSRIAIKGDTTGKIYIVTKRTANLFYFA